MGLRPYASLALALAWFRTNSGAAAGRLLALAQRAQRTPGARLAVHMLSLVLDQGALQLLGACTRSFDPYARAGACSALGVLFRQTANERVVELLCRMMQDADEGVRCAAYVAQALVL